VVRVQKQRRLEHPVVDAAVTRGKGNQTKGVRKWQAFGAKRSSKKKETGISRVIQSVTVGLTV